MTDAASAAVAVAPRVQLKDIEAGIAAQYYLTGDKAVMNAEGWGDGIGPQPDPLAVLTICIVVMKNGFTVIGKAAPASPENFNRDLGRKFAYEDAIRQLWPLMGFALRDRLHDRAAGAAAYPDDGRLAERNPLRRGDAGSAQVAGHI